MYFKQLETEDIMHKMGDNFFMTRYLKNVKKNVLEHLKKKS